MTYRVGFIGTGADPDSPDADGYAMAYRHAAAYRRLDDCELVACADIVRANAEAFAQAHGIDERHVYEDHLEMLADADLDIVSVCTPPAVHASIVIETARSGAVDAIHCEKPMADTIGDAREMVRVCEEAGVQLTINHQYRYGRPYAEVKRLLDEGAIGAVRRFEFGHTTLFDTGSHFFDLCNWYNDYAPVEWMLAQVDYTEKNRMFGVHNENQAIAQWRYENGVYGLASTGRGDGFNEGLFRVVGTEGELRIGGAEGVLRLRQDGTGWRTVDTGRDGIWSDTSGRVDSVLKRLSRVAPGRLGARLEPTEFIDRAIEAAVVGALEDGQESPLNARDALASQELVFAAWESVRRRGRVDFPLDIDDNPLTSMVEAGDLLTPDA